MMVIVQYQRKSGKLISIDRYTDDEQDVEIVRLRAAAATNQPAE